MFMIQKAQSITEYIVLLMVVSAAFMVMYRLASDAVNGRLAIFSKMVDTSQQ